MIQQKMHAQITKRKEEMKFLQPTNLYVEAKRRLQELKKIYVEREERLQNYPPGKLRVAKSRGRIQLYIRMDAKEKSGIYLSKTEDKKRKLYLQKSYDEKIVKAIEKEINNISSFLLNSEKYLNQIEQIFNSYPEEFKSSIESIELPQDDYLKYWLSIPFENKSISDNVPVYETNKGERVRSKSELNIANALYRHGIPYKYECPLMLKSGAIIYPDFTVLDLTNRRELYWEHRGMMDDREYAKHTVQRIREYERSNIWPGKTLILTEETSAAPFGTNEIDAVIRHYFGNDTQLP